MRSQSLNVTEFLLLFRCVCSVGVFLYEPGVLGDHVRDAVNDGISDAELLLDQLVGRSIIPGGRIKSVMLKSSGIHSFYRLMEKQ